MTSVTGSGPIAITSSTGAHLTVPLSALSESGGAVTVNNWPVPADVGNNTRAANWASYLFKQGSLVDAPSVASAPAFVATATVPGAAGNGTTLTVSQVTAQNPSYTSTLKLEVDVSYTVDGLTPDNLGVTIGTVAGGGSKPGLVYLNGTVSATTGSDSPPTAPVGLAGGNFTVKTQGGDSWFVLSPAHSDDSPTNFTVSVSGTCDNFSITVAWNLIGPSQKLSDHASTFSDVIKITPPAGAGFGVPQSATPVTLSGGADPAGSTAAVAASATVLSA